MICESRAISSLGAHSAALFLAAHHEPRVICVHAAPSEPKRFLSDRFLGLGASAPPGDRLAHRNESVTPSRRRILRSSATRVSSVPCPPIPSEAGRANPAPEEMGSEHGCPTRQALQRTIRK